MQQPGKLSLKQQQLSYQNDETSLKVPLEDVAVIILETPQATITSALLSAIAQRGVAVLTCGEDHHPNGILLGFHGYHRQRLQLESQIAWSLPFKKRCWQKLIQQKLRNQASNLNSLEEAETAGLIEGLVDSVTSGDTTNREAVGAKRYWQALGGKAFTRRQSNGFNAAVNYGYAIVRASLARHLVALGFLPALGLHHQNQLNAYNLADDLLEPYRPWVDCQVKAIEPFLTGEQELAVTDRAELASIAGESCLISGETHSLLRATELTVQSLARASKEKNAEALVLPVV